VVAASRSGAADTASSSWRPCALSVAGAEAECRWMFFAFEMRDGKVRRSWSYLDEAEALKAVGLEE